MPILPKQQPPYYEVTTTTPNPKKYIALLNQTGTNAPVTTVLENTLAGEISFSYISPGLYTLDDTLEEFTDATKVEIIYPSIIEASGSFVLVTVANSSQLTIQTMEAQGDGTYSAANGYLTNHSFEITVYP